MTKATAILAALLFGTSVLAETTIGSAAPEGGEDKIGELFDEVRKVAGSRLVTLRIGPFGKAPFVPGAVTVVGPPEGSAICVRAISRDGLYAMQTRYVITTPGDLVNLTPFSKSYANLLDDYPSEDIAVFAFVTADPACQERDATVLPVISEVPGDYMPVQALVNSRNRKVTVALQSGDAVIDLPCEKPREAARITHDNDCRGQIPPGYPLGLAELRVTTDDGLVRKTERYDVILGTVAP